ncbi:hypothetical protein BDZ97DRAFT_2011528 [Flammula alnicola]|nr:hypothetical protein BDZ97DRAFT_2011528 [Flammula alnicola]
MSFHFPARDPAFNVRQGLESAKKRTAPISLLISPNLDALLEHEERTRALSEPRTPDHIASKSRQCRWRPTLAWAQVSAYAVVWKPAEQPTISRTHRAIGSGNRDEVAPIQAVPLSPVSSSTSNPYINPAPTLDEVLRVGITSQLSDSTQATTVKSYHASTRRWMRTTNKKRRGRTQRSHSKYPSLPLPYGKSVDAATQNLEASQPTFSKAGSPFTSILTHPLIAAQSRRRKIMKQKEGSVPDMQQATLPSPDDSERGRGALNSGVASIPWRRRPLISHAPQSLTIKRIFSHAFLVSVFSKDKDQKISEKPLPPTTNFLDMDERADLIRKSRKLARVFGQTPDADAMAQQDSGRSITSTLMNGQPRNRYCQPDVRESANPRTTNLQLEIEGVSSSDLPVNHAITQNRSNSPTSFIDLSDDEGTKPGKKAATPRSHSPSQSILTMTPDEQADEERRRKRERLAKLHRFLGSRVPANLRAPTSSKGASSESDDSSRKTWLKRRRSSSAAILPSSWPEELERVKEELDDKEKALNVRRAHKMEKVFGVAPPQTLYHTRHCPAPSVAVKPVAPIPVAITPDAQAPQPAQRNPNRSAYVKTKTKKNNRPGTSESSKQLLPKDSGNSGFGDHHSLNPGHSLIYNHYQHSLNSLNDILDKDDKESLQNCMNI